jgi:hypothetical protein
MENQGRLNIAPFCGLGKMQDDALDYFVPSRMWEGPGGRTASLLVRHTFLKRIWGTPS